MKKKERDSRTVPANGSLKYYNPIPVVRKLIAKLIFSQHQINLLTKSMILWISTRIAKERKKVGHFFESENFAPK
jgi:hypothetical protein